MPCIAAVDSEAPDQLVLTFMTLELQVGRRALEHGSDGFFVFFAETVVPKTVSAGRRVRRGSHNIGRGSENGGV